MNFFGKIAVVTGAASGIGEAIARGLAQGGARVAALDIKPAATDLYIQCDVGDDESVSAAARRIEAKLGAVHIVIHCAAVSVDGSIVSTAIADYARIMNVNLYGAVRLAKAFAPAMRLRGQETGSGGAFLFVSSINAKYATPNLGAYAASKAALDSVTKTLAVELAPDGVRVNSIQPASVDTPLLRSGYARLEDPAPAIAANVARHPLGRWGTPEDAAKLALFLVSDDASWITGAHYALDGGASVTRK